ncbi:MAG: hypothetical protein NT067_06065 [Candidatus Diapherotrites archaeon]|nr:hypothetical protein [Candidatus Diapherotrites archaeon]
MGKIEELRAKFLDLYVNLPIPFRREVILVVDKQVISWNVAYIEIKGETALGNKILEELERLKLLG